jgi:hypothetical protein
MVTFSMTPPYTVYARMLAANPWPCKTLASAQSPW